jgi:hypothetical protein
MALLVLSSIIPGRAPAADDFKLEGRWKLVYIPEGRDVQDDADKRVLHAVQASVPDAE